jgi:hypothetical protein
MRHGIDHPKELTVEQCAQGAAACQKLLKEHKEDAEGLLLPFENIPIILDGKKGDIRHITSNLLCPWSQGGKKILHRSKTQVTG